MEIWLRSFWARAWIEAKTKGVAQQKITLEIFRQLPIALPSLVEQQEIVELVIRKQSELNEMVDRQNIEAVATLRQSILAAAFRGELTA